MITEDEIKELLKYTHIIREHAQSSIVLNYRCAYHEYLRDPSEDNASRLSKAIDMMNEFTKSMLY